MCESAEFSFLSFFFVVHQYRQTVLKRAFARFVHLFCTLYYKRISLWKLHGLWKLQFKNCFRIDRFAVLGPQECLEFVCRILWTVRSQGELCFVFGSICAIIGLFRSQGRTLLRVWIDLCDY